MWLGPNSTTATSPGANAASARSLVERPLPSPCTIPTRTSSMVTTLRRLKRSRIAAPSFLAAAAANGARAPQAAFERAWKRAPEARQMRVADDADGGHENGLRDCVFGRRLLVEDRS